MTKTQQVSAQLCDGHQNVFKVHHTHIYSNIVPSKKLFGARRVFATRKASAQNVHRAVTATAAPATPDLTSISHIDEDSIIDTVIVGAGISRLPTALVTTGRATMPAPPPPPLRHCATLFLCSARYHLLLNYNDSIKSFYRLSKLSKLVRWALSSSRSLEIVLGAMSQQSPMTPKVCYGRRAPIVSNPATLFSRLLWMLGAWMISFWGTLRPRDSSSGRVACDQRPLAWTCIVFFLLLTFTTIIIID